MTASLYSEDEKTYTISHQISNVGIATSGPVSPNLSKSIIEPDVALNEDYSRTGWSLSIAKYLVELMSGQIGCRHDPSGSGNLFWFTARFAQTKYQISDQVRPKPTDTSENDAKCDNADTCRHGIQEIDGVVVRCRRELLAARGENDWLDSKAIDSIEGVTAPDHATGCHRALGIIYCVVRCSVSHEAPRKVEEQQKLLAKIDPPPPYTISFSQS